MKKIVILPIIAVLSFMASALLASQNEDFIQIALKNLGIDVSGQRKQIEVALPNDLAQTSQWGVHDFACKNGGYDLSAYSGQAVFLTSFPIKQLYGTEPLNVHILSKDNAIICIYVAVQEGSTLTPGVFAINDPKIHKK
ncbi:MAG: hypothetical protein A2787_04770 [Omnitrophica WOR_2 bacterium RIFCSPHIGHO2_01_FULL_48_9]|nr:MAG: hypothetical protein A2787_04770 [Omnitrophica WOR_2 bacterium RIFCSPHIGHO2_01_FULL_48_9]